MNDKDYTRELATITDEDRAAAHAVLDSWGQSCRHPGHNTDCSDIAQAIAEARERGIREGVELAKEHAWVSDHDGWHQIAPCIDWEGVDEAIAERRKP